MAEDCSSGGVGTLSEKAMHKALKLYIEPDASRHEQPLAGYVADIINEGGAIEVQTGDLAILAPKLRTFLEIGPVTVVRPVAVEWRIRWVDPDTAEITPSSRTVRSNRIYSLGRGLCKLWDILLRPDFTLVILTLSLDEYKIRRDKVKRGQRRRIERIPRELISEIRLCRREDYLIFLPDSLGDEFTMAEYLKAIRSRSRYDQYSLHLLCRLGLVERRQQGRKYVYNRIPLQYVETVVEEVTQ